MICFAIDLMVTLLSFSIFCVSVVPIVVELTNEMLVNGLEKEVLLVTSEYCDLIDGEK
jgi:hypothetical protein